MQVSTWKDGLMGDRDVTHKMMVIIKNTRLEAIEAIKLNEPLKTKTTAANAKRVVHTAVKRQKIILVAVPLGDTLWPEVTTSSLTCFERGWHHYRRAQRTTLGRHTD